MSLPGASGGQPGPQRSADQASAFTEPARAYAELAAATDAS
ncbi:hypothetical protein [Micromonospora parastrephiae]|nr:hypothetical protein [Micromonospora parastrephiae]